MADSLLYKITIVGTGSGEQNLLSTRALHFLADARIIAVRAGYPDWLSAAAPHARFETLPDPQEGLDQLRDWVNASVQQIESLRSDPQGVIYVTSGNPMDDDPVSLELLTQARAAGCGIEVVPASGLAEKFWVTVEQKPGIATARIQAAALAGWHMPPFSPSGAALIAGVQTGKVAADLVKVLSSVYPLSHPIYWVNGAQVNQTMLASLAVGIPGRVDLIYLPELADSASLEGFQEIIAHLRAPDGCPWDREQTHLSLRKSLLEETYEALEAMDAQDKAGMVEELGDIMLQIALHAQIGAEAGEFRMADILGGIYAKIVRRHPHVFGDAQVEGVGGVLQNWEKLKAQERKTNGENSSKKGILDGIPAVFPSLAQAQEMQDRAARVGFDWPDRQGVLDKLNEEIEEYRAAANIEEKTSEMGDVLFSLVNLARWEKIDAETALRAANVRFRQRFGGVESSAENSGRAVSDLTLDEMNGFWDEAKRRQRGE